MLFSKLLNYFFNNKCTHEKILPNQDFSYCPDCGKFIQNEWYLTRCSCCGVKLISRVHDGEVKPLYSYCQNCGSNTYEVSKIEKINFIDINYAVLIKKELETQKNFKTIQCWQEKSNEQPKLIAQFQ